MSKTITIDRLHASSHAKITLQLDNEGEVAEAYFHVTQFRGFEKICVAPVLRDAVPHGADLRDLSGEPSARLGKKLAMHCWP